MATKKNMAPVTSSVEATLPNGDVIRCASVTPEVWDRYLEKIRKNQHAVGRRELVQTLCVSHQLDERGRIPVLDKYPVLTKALADALETEAGGEIAPETEDGSVTVSVDGLTCTLSGPDTETWEALGESMSDNGQRYGDTLRAFLSTLADDSTTLAAILAKKPALMGPLTQSVGVLAGAGIKVSIKKG